MNEDIVIRVNKLTCKEVSLELARRLGACKETQYSFEVVPDNYIKSLRGTWVAYWPRYCEDWKLLGPLLEWLDDYYYSEGWRKGPIIPGPRPDLVIAAFHINRFRMASEFEPRPLPEAIARAVLAAHLEKEQHELAPETKEALEKKADSSNQPTQAG